MENLTFEAIQSHRDGTATASTRVHLFTVFFLVIVVQRMDKIEEISEHGDSILAGSPYLRHNFYMPLRSYQRGTQELFGFKADKTIC